MAGKKGVGASAPTQINVVNAEALKIGPDEVLILRMDDMGDDPQAIVDDLLAHLTALGIEDRTLIIQGDVEMALVKRNG